MSPVNRAPLSSLRTPTVGARPLPPPRFSGRLVSPGMPRMPPPPSPRMARMLPPPPRMPPRMPPLPPLPPMRQRLSLLRPAGVSRPNGLLPHFPRPRHTRGITPGIIPPMVSRGTRMLRGPPPRHWFKRPPSQIMPPPPPPRSPPIRARFSIGNGNVKDKPMGSAKKLNSSKLEELELKKPWMTDEIRSEVQKKNRLYAKAKKNKDTEEWKEFKGVRNKVTRMLRDARNEYFAKHPEQAHLYPDDEEVYDERDENYVSSDDDTTYYCEICDREFLSEDALSEHKSTHIICNIDGCTFSAFPLLVEKHIRMQHSTGLYQRMKNLSTPEDIEKWIIERKKKYPTKTNIELHKAKELEKSQRGEIIRQNYRIQTKTTGKASNMRGRKRKCRKQHTYKLDGNSSDSHVIYRGLRPFPGTSILEEDMNEIQLDEQTKQTDAHEEIADNISDEDDISQPFVEAKPVSLPTLVADYHSEEDEDEVPEEVPLKRIRENIINHKIAENAKTVCEEITNNIQSYANTNNKSIKQIKIDKMSQQTVAKHKDNHNNETNRVAINKRNEQTSHRHQNKLLQLLLSRSIQHERNLICQCLKYIIDHNFFNP